MNSKEASGRADDGGSSQKSERSFLNRSVERRAEAEGVPSSSSSKGPEWPDLCLHMSRVRLERGRPMEA